MKLGARHLGGLDGGRGVLGLSAVAVSGQYFERHDEGDKPTAKGRAYAAGLGAGVVEMVDCRFEEAGFKTVLIRDSILPKPFFSLSLGTDGPPCAGELIFAAVLPCRLPSIQFGTVARRA